MAEVKNISLKGLSKEKINITDENGKGIGVIELDLNDTNVINRIANITDKVEEIVSQLPTNDDITVTEFTDKRKAVDKQLCDLIDEVFDSPIAEVVSGGKSMIDVIDGELRFMYILGVFANLYGDKYSKEMTKMMKKLSQNKTVSKYVKHPADK